MAEQKNSNASKIIIGILILAIGALAYMLTTSKGEVEDLGSEKEKLVFDLEQMKASLEDQESSNDSLDAYIVDEIARLEATIDSVQAISAADAKELKKYKNRVWALKQREKKFVSQIDSLNAAYETVRMEKEKVEMNLATEQQKNMDLSETNRSLERDVAVGSMIQATSLNATAYKLYKSGKTKATARARRANRISTCAAIAKNPLTNPGAREVFVRITSADNKVMAAKSEEGNSFEFNGQPLIYSAKAEIDYQNETMDVCVDFDKESFSAGEYKVEMFTEGYKLGETVMVLR